MAFGVKCLGQKTRSIKQMRYADALNANRLKPYCALVMSLIVGNGQAAARQPHRDTGLHAGNTGHDH